MPSQLRNPLYRKRPGKPFDLSAELTEHRTHMRSLNRSAPRDSEEVSDFIERRREHNRQREATDKERLDAFANRPWSNEVSTARERKAAEIEATRVQKMYYLGLPYIPPPEHGKEVDGVTGVGEKRKVVVAKPVVKRNNVVQVQNEIDQEAYGIATKNAKEGGYVGIEEMRLREKQARMLAKPDATRN